MKRVLFILAAVLMLALFAAPSTPVSADTSAVAGCVSDPPSGPLGTTFVITCIGFDPNEMVTAWTTEPDGQVTPAPGGKTDKHGTFSLAFTSQFGGISVALGQWAVTVRSAKTGLTMIGRFNVSGGTEGVKGALLTADSTGFVTGMGFLPGEPVSVWVEFPNGDCSGNWAGIPPIGISTLPFGTVTADADGVIQFQFSVSKYLCRGTYHIVARGVKSGIGGEIFLTQVNVNVTESAVLTVTPTNAFIIGSHLVFEGTGYGAKEPVSCWETTPQGAALPIGSVTADASGSFSIGFTTGLFGIVGEGPIGEYAMTCKGGVTGATGIARFTLTGHAVVDP